MKKLISAMLLLALLASIAACNIIKNPAVKEYVPGQGNIKGNVDVSKFTEADPRFEIGATFSGEAVFKDPYEAYSALVEKYSEGISLIQTEFDLQPLTRSNYDMYKQYGSQVTTGTAEQQKQAMFVSGFLDIYENSYD